MDETQIKSEEKDQDKKTQFDDESTPESQVTPVNMPTFGNSGTKKPDLLEVPEVKQ